MNAHEVLTLDAVRPDATTTEKLDRLQRLGLIVGVAASVLFLFSFLQGAGSFFQSYLFGYLCWAAIAIGAIPLIMLQYLINGEWGATTMRFLEAATRTQPLVALLFIPVLLGLPHTHIWANNDALAQHPEVAHLVELKADLYLNTPFFLVRAIIYFAVWGLLAYFLNKWSRLLDETGNPRYGLSLWRLSGIGMILFGLMVTFAAFDWIMSLNPSWYSGIFGVIVGVGFAVEAWAFTVLMVRWLSPGVPMSRVVSRKIYADFGNLMLALVMIWTYVQLSQLIIIWSANLPEETTWYAWRVTGGWRAISWLLGLFHFFLPFLLLLNGEIRRSGKAMAAIAALLFAMRFLDTYFMVMPPFSFFHTDAADWGRRIAVHWQDFVAPVAIGGFWLAYFAKQLKKLPLLPVGNPNLPEVQPHA
jgi:hypothetical protein